MADIFSKSKRSGIMKSIRPRGNVSTEQRFKECLKDSGIKGWRCHLNLPGRPDFVFRKPRKIAVFVDGCFWHGCPRCFRLPKTNRKFWLKKVTYNRSHDRDINRRLRTIGWIVIRIPEHLVRKSPGTALRRLSRYLS